MSEHDAPRQERWRGIPLVWARIWFVVCLWCVLLTVLAWGLRWFVVPLCLWLLGNAVLARFHTIPQTGGTHE